jgi:hypothetical protein
MGSWVNELAGNRCWVRRKTHWKSLLGDWSSTRFSGSWVGLLGFSSGSHGSAVALGLRVAGSPEIASPASSGLVGATHQRIGLHLPQLSRSHLSLSISRSLPLKLSLNLSSQSLDLTLCELLEHDRKKNKERRRKEKKGGKEKEGEGFGDAGDKGENEGKITEMPLTLNLTTFYPLLYTLYFSII